MSAEPLNGPAMPSRADMGAPQASPLVRVALLECDNDQQDWYFRQILEGLDAAAMTEGIAIELLGKHSSSPQVLTRRLERNRPDVMVVVAASSRQALAVGEAVFRNIPCLLAGPRLRDFGLPTVCEDGRLGVIQTLHHLVEHGHRRIGLVNRPDSNWWEFDCLQGYHSGLRTLGIEPDERLVYWAMGEEYGGEGETGSLAEWRRRERPTALILTHPGLLQPLDDLLKSDRLQIPRDLSVVVFGQGGDHHLTTMELPLREMGLALARMARQTVMGKKTAPLTLLPCRFVAGDSVRRLA